MKHRILYCYFLLLLLNFSFSACSQDTTHTRILGNTPLEVKTLNYSADTSIILVQLHHNEQTASNVAERFSDSLKIGFLQINNWGERLISFRMNGKNYRFDPNRIFSKDGIRASLEKHSTINEEASAAVDSLGKWLLGLLPAKTIVALHNNSDEEFTLNDYEPYKTGLVYQNPLLDADDFFITTDSILYEGLKERNFNVVWEWSDKLKDDGSLSIYCGRNKIAYVNIEAEHGHTEQQAAMLGELLQILKQNKK